MGNKKLVITALLLALGITACGGATGSENQTGGNTISEVTENTGSADGTLQTGETTAEETEPASEEANAETVTEAEASSSNTETEESPAPSTDTLVVYFSATGTTQGVAERIASVTNADLYEILAAEPYSEADLNWHDNNSRTTHEQNDASVRPEIASEDLSLDGYSTIYIGYPIWWGEEPRIMDTFVEKYSFDGITLIPFCTSGGSGIGRSGTNLEENAGNGTWLPGERFSGSVTEEELASWVDGLQ